MNQIFVHPSSIENKFINIRDPKKIRHLRTVLRIGLGDEVWCFDGSGRRFRATFRKYNKGMLVLEILENSIEDAIITPIVLAAALIKPSLFEQIIRGASELGVEGVVPLTTERTVIRSSQIESKLTRWEKIATESAEQCRRSKLMKIERVQSLSNYLKASCDSLTLIATCSKNAFPIVEKLAEVSRANRVSLIIGPEGDFSADEIQEAIQHGAHPVSMGALTLRSETAAVAALSIIRYSLGFV